MKTCLVIFIAFISLTGFKYNNSRSGSDKRQASTDSISPKDHLQELLERDTTDFDLSAFRHDKRDNIKSILERIPLFIFDQDGGLSFANTSISKVWIDGKDQYKSIGNVLKTTPASSVSRIQIINDYSNTANQGIKEIGPDKVLNIVTNKNTVFAVKQH